MIVRKYESKDIPAMIAIWNEVVEDDSAGHYYSAFSSLPGRLLGCRYSDHEIQSGYVITVDPTDCAGNRHVLHVEIKNQRNKER